MRVIISFTWFIVCCFCQQDDPIIDTIYGQIRGSVKENDNGQQYEEYLGIPYGAPPIGADRFTKSKPPESWDEVRDAKEYSAHCVQYPPTPFLINGLSNVTSEDCLYLNLFVPGVDRQDSNLAVIVYIHGGGFFQGTGALSPGYELALHGDVIVISINYRLGPLGFLTTEDDVAPGNYGLWDVKLALEWIRDNVDAFGGDPNRVSVFGLSAGGVLVGHTLISPQTDDLVHRGGAFSGASSGFFGVSIPGNAANSTYTLARSVGCESPDTSQEVVDCLRDVDAFELSYWGFNTVVSSKRQLPNFMPVIDGDFIPMDPKELWNQGAADNKEFISGATIHDCARYVMPNPTGSDNYTFNWAATKRSMDLVLKFVLNHYPGDFDEMRDAIYEQYPDLDSNDTLVRTQAAVEATTDGVFDTWAHYEASQHARTSQLNTYLYEYAYSNSFLEKTRNIDHSDWIVAWHGDDLNSIFGEPYRQVYRENELNDDFDDVDKQVSDYVMTYYTNFAKTGNPNIGQFVPAIWPEYNINNSRNYLQISETPTSLQQTDSMLDNYRFWNQEFREIAIPPDYEDISIMNMSDEEFEEALQEGMNMVDELIDIIYEGDPDEYFLLIDEISSALERRRVRQFGKK